MAKDLKDKVVAIHGRKSRDNGASLESQINACIEWCEKNGIVNYEIFQEEGSISSEEWDERPVLQELLTKLEQYHYDMVIVTEQSRICRSDDFPKFREVLKEADVLFVQADTGSIYDYQNPEDEFVSDIMQAVYKQELNRTKIRLKRGIIQSAKKGNWVGKKVPVGYKYDKHSKRLKLSDDAPVIRRMFEMYLEGKSLNDIAFTFTHEPVIVKYHEKGEDKNMVWTSATLSRLINNPAYVGHSLYGRSTDKKVKGKRKRTLTDVSLQILEEGTHDGIVTQEEWDKVQAILAKRNSRPISLKLAKHTFSGLIRCAECGAIHSFQSSKGGKRRITSCQTRHYSDDLTTYSICINGGCNLEPFEELFYLELKKQEKKLKDYLEDIQEATTKTRTAKMKKQTQTLSSQKMIQQLKTQMENIQKGFELGIYAGQEEEKAKEIKKLKAQIKMKSEEVKEAKANEDVSEGDKINFILDNINKFLNNPFLPQVEANEILLQLIETIFYKKEGKEPTLDIVWKDKVKEVIQQIA